MTKIESQVRRVTDEETALLAKALKVEINALYEQLKTPNAQLTGKMRAQRVFFPVELFVKCLGFTHDFGEMHPCFVTYQYPTHNVGQWVKRLPDLPEMLRHENNRREKLIGWWLPLYPNKPPRKLHRKHKP